MQEYHIQRNQILQNFNLDLLIKFDFHFKIEYLICKILGQSFLSELVRAKFEHFFIMKLSTIRNLFEYKDNSVEGIFENLVAAIGKSCILYKVQCKDWDHPIYVLYVKNNHWECSNLALITHQVFIVSWVSAQLHKPKYRPTFNR